MRKKGLWLGLLVLLLLLPASTVFADGPGLNFDDGQFFVEEDVSLEPGATFNGDLGIFDGDLTVPHGSAVNGDVFVTNGDADIAGRVNGDLAILSGDLTLTQTGSVQGDVFCMSGDQEIAGRVNGDLSLMFGDMELLSTAVVAGDLMVVSGSVERETGAQVFGEAMPEIPLPRIPFVPEQPKMPEMPVVPEVPEIPQVPEAPEWQRPSPPPLPQIHRDTMGDRIGRFFGRTMMASFLSLVFIGLGMLIVLIWPRNTRQVSDCIAALPVQSFGLGLLTFLIALMLEALAAVLMILIILVAAALIATVILIPIGLLLILLSVLVLLPVPIALVGGVVLGWVGLADLVGRKVLKVLNVGDATPLGAVLAGLLVTVSLAAMLWVLTPFCCGWLFVVLLTSVGLGAAIHTRFGTQSCRSTGQAADAAANAAAEAEVLPLEAMDDEAGQPDFRVN